MRERIVSRSAQWLVSILAILAFLPFQTVSASSHREAPFVTEHPKVDGTDFYMFSSYENGRSDYVTIIANYLPLQDSYGGPNYFTMDPDAHYDINIDNDGDAKEDITFRFQFKNTLKDLSLEVGPDGNKETVSVALVNIGSIGPNAAATSSLNVEESYRVSLVKNGKGKGKSVTQSQSGSSDFLKPVDNIGNKTLADYATYANQHIHPVSIPGCGVQGRVFVGQRAEPFVVNLGETFDLVNYNPVDARDSQTNTIGDKNITSLIVEVHRDCLTKGDDSVIAGWTSASLPKRTRLKQNPSFNKPARNSRGKVQVSRLANPLVNEVVIGLKDKDRFNASQPSNDGQFATYVTNPTFPEILELLFGVQAPNLFPRTDLVAIFLTGIDGLNKTDATAEMMRLNTAIAPKAADQQSSLGVLGGDTAGYPNGRRPGDDVVDITLRAAMGVLLTAADAPDGQLPYNDGAIIDATMFGNTFPYLNTPVPGSPE